MKELRYYYNAILLWASLWDVCWWHYNEKYAQEKNPYVMNCITAWEVASGIWLKE